MMPLEKIDWLISKLQRQHQAGAGAGELLATLQLLQTELGQQMANGHADNKSITIVMPAPTWNMNASDELAAYETDSLHSADEEKVVFELEPFVHVEKPADAASSAPSVITITAAAPEMHKSYLPEKKEVAAPKDVAPPDITVPPIVIVPPANPTPPVTAAPMVSPPAAAPPSVEAVEMKSPVIKTEPRSLNDLMEKPADELFNRLHEPIKDLKKAISINDRFQYITNLFSNDEAMYDRSIKTINNFNVYSEAEYWIRRELAVKHGWRDTDPLVKGFYNLVSRRFSAM